MATISHTQWWFIRPMSAGEHQGVVLYSELPCPRTHARAAMPGSLVRGCLLVIRSKPVHVHTHGYIRTYTCIHIYIYTCVHTYIHIHRPSGYPPPADALHCRCPLPAQTLKSSNCKSSLKLTILQQPGYLEEIVQ